jgi:filamentous hemagglutinin family protein
MIRFLKAFAILIGMSNCLLAAPRGFQCKAGDAKPPQEIAGKWTIQANGDSIIHWDSFSIEPSELVHFQQGGSHSAILNRVVGSSKSELLGHLTSNGKVFLLNPNGVLIGPNGRVETAGFIASSYDVMNEEFLRSKEMLFAGASKESVVNLGTIECPTGDVALIAFKVQNEGRIVASDGVVSLAAGMEILLKPEGTERVYIQAEGTNESIEHAGAIQALAIEMRTSSPYEKAIRSSGTVEASAKKEEGGRIYLVADKGGAIELQGSQLKGNTVHVLSEEIRISKSEIDVSGESGGEILIGGDYQGSNSYAERVFVDADSTLNANALANGNGGKVICWSDDQMAHFGKVNALGGAESGDGGLVEISGKRHLIFEGLVDTTAPFGQAGTLLLDPIGTITISTAADTGTAGTVWKFGGFTNNVVNTTTLANQLDLTNVTIMTPDPTYDVADSTITVASLINWNAPTTLTLVASSIFINAVISNNVGGSGLTLTGYGNGAPNTPAVGVTVSAQLSLPLGTITFQNCVGGTATAGNNYGVEIISTVNAHNIIATDCYGGPGLNDDFGFLVNGGTVGSTTTQNIEISGGSLGLGSNEIGINITSAGTVQVGDGGVISLFGTGGGAYNGTGTANFGIELFDCTLTAGNGGTQAATINVTGIGGSGSGGSHFGVSCGGLFTPLFINLNNTNPASALNFINCVGGSGGSNNDGIDFVGSFTLAQGSLNFKNVVGGSGGTGADGVVINSGKTVTAPAILATDCYGGPGTGTDIGFFINGGTLGSSLANQISISAGSLGTGSNEVGIQASSNSQIIVGDGGTISLVGTGGGVYNGSGSDNHGVEFNACTLTAGNGGTQATAINVTGIGGSGSGGTNFGVSTSDPFAVNLNNSNPASALNFLNCVGGSGGINNTGVSWADFTLVHGSLNFKNCVGGSGGTGATIHHGVAIDFGTVSAPTIIATDCYGGPGAGSDVGFEIFGGTLGSSITNLISISAGSLGTGSNEVGISVDSGGKIVVGDGGTISLVGTGGGAYNGSGTNNHGVSLHGCTLTAGNGGIQATTINVTGIGGSGSGGFNFGVNIATSFAVNLNNSNSASAINFINCLGGSGGTLNAASNYGINFNASLNLVNGSLNFQNITGGSGGSGTTDNHGVFLNDVTVSAPVILATDCYGGPGMGSDVGFNLFFTSTGATLGSSSTNLISISAGSLGTGTSEVGIQAGIGSQVIVGDGGTISLFGMGGGAYNGSGSDNHGVFINGTLTAGNGGSQATTINISGIGGSGSGGGHAGVSVLFVPPAFNLNNTNPASSLNFINCIGGSGGTGNDGVFLFGPFTLAHGSLNFKNVVGGSGGSAPTAHNGVQINGTVSAPAILATDCYGGPGTGTDVGFYLPFGALGSSSTNLISISAGSLGTGSNEIGIQINTGVTVGDGGTMSLFGIGGGAYNGSGINNIGVALSGCTLTAGNGGSPSTAVNVSGIGGSGSGGSHFGVSITGLFAVNLNNTNSASALTFINCIGGSGGHFNYGVNFATSLALVNGSLNFRNVVGGSGGSGTTHHDGVEIASGQLVQAPVILATDCYGGPGTGSDIGINIIGTLGGNAGNVTPNVVIISGGSLGTGSNEYGIAVTGGVGVGSGATATLSLTGTGGGVYNGSGTLNHGIYINNATIDSGSGASVLTLTGLGGSGAGTNAGVYIDMAGLEVLFGSSLNNQLNFLNCIGGFVGSNNYGVYVGGPVIILGAGQTQFLNATGGGNGTGHNNNGLHFAANFSPPQGVIIAEANGGFGLGSTSSNGNYGVYVAPSVTLGSATTNQIRLTGTSYGTGSFEFGIKVDGTGAIQVGDGGSLSLKGSGGGSYNGAGSNNYGVELNNATLTAGNGGTTVNAINVSGFGGVGSGGNHYGVDIPSALTITLNGSNPNNVCTFLDCIGGSGGNNNHGVNITSTATAANGQIQFLNVAGGGSGSANSNFGINLTGSLSAAAIIGRDIFGGPTTGTSNTGLFLSGTLGSSTTQMVSMQAGSLGSGSNQYGIDIESGNATVGNGGILALTGTGGGAYNSSGSANHGININGAVLTSGTAGILKQAITLSGIGGQGTGGGHDGVNVMGAVTVSLGGSNANNALSFLNTSGGSGGSTNVGVNFNAAATLTMASGTLSFFNVSGGDAGGFGGASTNNHGVFIPAGFTLNAPNLSTIGVEGGQGTGSDIGFYVNGGTVLSTTTALNIEASSKGTGTGEVGIQVDNGGTVSTSGTAALALTGSSSTSGTTTCHGVSILGGGVVRTTGSGSLAINGAAPSTGPNGNFGVNLVAAATATIVVETTSTGSIAINGNSNSSILSGGAGINMSSCTVNAAAGNIAYTGIQNSDILLGDCTISAVGAIAINGTTVLTSSAPNPVTVSGSTGVAFNGTIDGNFNLVAASGAGPLAFNGNVGSNTALNALTSTSSTSYTIGGSVTLQGGGNSINMTTGNVTLTTPSILTTSNGPIALGGTVNGTSLNGQNLTFNPGTNSITVNGNAGNLVPLSNVSIVNATTSTFSGSLNASTFSQLAGSGLTTVSGAAATTGALGISLIGNSFSFGSTVTTTPGAGDGGPLWISSTVNITIAGATTTTGAAGANGGHVTLISKTGSATVGNINTNSAGSGGNVDIYAIGGSVTIADINTSGASGSGGNVILQPDAGYSGGFPAGLLILNGTTITTTGTGTQNGFTALSLAGRTTPSPGVATIVSTNGSGVTISTGTLLMGPYECLTVFGNISLTMQNYSALSDIVAGGAGGTVTISAPAGFAPSNYVLTRAPLSILKSDGTTYTSPTTHILAANVVLSGMYTPTITPGGLTVNIGNVAGGIPTAALTFMGHVLNFDSASSPPPPPPPPGPPGPPAPPSPAVQQEIDRFQFNVAASEGLFLNNLPTVYWADYFWPIIPELGPWNPLRLSTFVPPNFVPTKKSFRAKKLFRISQSDKDRLDNSTASSLAFGLHSRLTLTP